MMKSNLDIANEVMQGKWGVGETRKQKITKAGYDYNTIQAMVNEMVTTGKPIKEITLNGKECCGYIINIEV